MLRLEGLRASYGKVEALKGVSLQVSLGELVTLIGANGAGKTSTLKAISGVLRPTGGRILFEGGEIHRLTPREILTRGIAHCPEGRRVFPYLTVRENLEMGAYVRTDIRLIREDLERVFAYFPILAERLYQTAGTLSGGEQQMLAIGRALMARPRLLLLDEPSLGLAPRVVEGILEVLRQVHHEGVGVFLVEQNVQASLALADRGYVLENGRISGAGSGRELLQDSHVRQAYLGPLAMGR